MTNKGRPKKITKTTIASKCLELYWKDGIQNVTYNAAIKYSDCSKGTMYNLFKSEDELHLNTLKFYIDNYLNKFERQLHMSNDIFDIIDFLFDSIKSNFCYYVVSNSNKRLLGKFSKDYVIKYENKIRKLLANLIIRHVNEYRLNPKNLDVLSLSAYLVHNFTLINIMKVNKSKSKDYLIIKEAMKEKIMNSLHDNNFSSTRK